MKRLFDDPALSAELRAELRADLGESRRAGEDYDTAAKLPQLRSALLAAALQPPAAVPELTRAKWSSLQHGPWTFKIALITIIGGASLFVALPAPRAPRPPTVVTPRIESTQAPAPEAPNIEPAAAVEVAPPKAPAAIPQHTTAQSSRREITQVVRIRALLERDPAAAYRLAQRASAEFPHGALREEREALQVLALAKSGEALAAQRLAQQFLSRYPRSPMRELVESALEP